MRFNAFTNIAFQCNFHAESFVLWQGQNVAQIRIPFWNVHSTLIRSWRKICSDWIKYVLYMMVFYLSWKGMDECVPFRRYSGTSMMAWQDLAWLGLADAMMQVFECHHILLVWRRQWWCLKHLPIFRVGYASLRFKLNMEKVFYFLLVFLWKFGTTTGWWCLSAVTESGQRRNDGDDDDGGRHFHQIIHNQIFARL